MCGQESNAMFPTQIAFSKDTIMDNDCDISLSSNIKDLFWQKKEERRTPQQLDY